MTAKAYSQVLAACSSAIGPAVVQADSLTAVEIKHLIAALAKLGLFAAAIDAGNLRGKPDLLRTLARAFHFPDYFGQNWDALVDCWSDMHWQPAKGYVCVVRGAEAFQKSDEAAYNTLLDVAGDVAERWKENGAGVIFKLVCCER